MEYITLRHSDLRVSRLCVGGCPMGGYGWGDVQEQELLDAIHTAVDAGVNFFDTADTYGLGQSERTLAKALGPRRRDVVIQTKFGVRAGDGPTRHDNSPAYIRQALEASLRRLNTDYIDIYVMHYWDGVTPPAEIAGTLIDAQKAGKIRYFGLSNVPEAHIADWLPWREHIVGVQYEFSLACRSHEAAFSAAAETLGLNPLTWGSLGQGILTGKYDASSTFGSDDRRSREIYVNFHGEKLLQNLRIVDKLREIAAQTGKSVPACAIRFILDHLPESVVIAGVKRPAQLLSNLEALDWSLDADALQALDRLSLGG